MRRLDVENIMRKVFLCLLIFVLSGCAGMKFGNDAVPLMAKEQLGVLEKLRTYHFYITEEDISKDFGKPIKGEGSRRPVWELTSGTKQTRIYAYFIRKDSPPTELNN
jgi:hypothetical protein